MSLISQLLFFLILAQVRSGLGTSVSNATNATTTTTFTATTTTTYTTTSTGTTTVTGTSTATATTTATVTATITATETGTSTTTGTATTTVTAPPVTTTKIISNAVGNNATGDANGTMVSTATTTSTITGTSTYTVTTYTVTTTVTGTVTTTIAPKEVVQGTLTMSVNDPDGFITDPGVASGIAKAIAKTTNVPESYVEVSLAKATRRLQRLQWLQQRQGRRLQGGGNVIVSYTITLPVTSSKTGASVSQSIQNTSPAAISEKILAEVSAASTETYTVSVTQVSAPAVLQPGETTTQAPTTTTATVTLTLPPTNSLTRTQAAFTAAHVMALLIGIMFMQ